MNTPSLRYVVTKGHAPLAAFHDRDDAELYRQLCNQRWFNYWGDASRSPYRLVDTQMPRSYVA